VGNLIRMDPDRLERAYQTALAALLAERNAAGHWTGELSTSALSTATAISALALVQKHSPSAARYDERIAGGIAWLAAHQNDDGGWGDTVKSISNISTAMLCRAAFHLTDTTKEHAEPLRRVEEYLRQKCGPTPAQQAEAIRARYGKDRTFSVPILMTGALAGLVPWGEVPPLPFELACLPQSWFRFVRLHVVSYALPALIAIGQAIYHHRPPRNPLTRLVRRLAIARSLRVLEAIQPSSGGFLEATPLTSFVTMALASAGQAEHPVARKAVEFLVRSVRPDGSWPIDSNLAIWVTTLAVNALAAAGELDRLDRVKELRNWLLEQQFRERHPYTGAAPGGWGWTDLPGSVPDADDTPGAILALVNLLGHEIEQRSVSEEGDSPLHSEFPYHRELTTAIRWLLDLQNRDGGWPTFCRGWGHLPFDRSGADLTAHVLRAIFRDRESVRDMFTPHARAIDRSLAYLSDVQRPDGSWLPLWFGNQFAPDDANPTYGTARVLAAYRDLDMMNAIPARRGVAWLLSAQNADGGWGGAAGVPSSVEETALAVEALLDAREIDASVQPVAAAVNRGLAWLVEQVERGGLDNPTPIGFYFAKLWYFEKFYPIIFSVAALGRARRKLVSRRDPARPSTPP
jgi:squalene-hopene/tetraprenyl-beta-curcumene cyclase